MQSSRCSSFPNRLLYLYSCEQLLTIIMTHLAAWVLSCELCFMTRGCFQSLPSPCLCTTAYVLLSLGSWTCLHYHVYNYSHESRRQDMISIACASAFFQFKPPGLSITGCDTCQCLLFWSSVAAWRFRAAAPCRAMMSTNPGQIDQLLSPQKLDLSWGYCSQDSGAVPQQF